MNSFSRRRLPVGAELVERGTSFRVWAPDHHQVRVVLAEGDRHDLEAEGDGYFSGAVSGLGAGDKYWFALGDGDRKLPDPASRFQPDGVDGPSQIVDPGTFRWTDSAWKGPEQGGVFYELHIGTFTKEGTFAAALEKLEWLKGIGVTVIEVMPINTWNGSFGWGYDGVLLFAPTSNYGTPDDVRRFVDRAHALGLGVILDVVYNHFGPGEICPLFTKDYFSQRPANEWGKTINFDGPNSQPVRDFFTGNAAYWIDEFHFDGLRIDATQALLDDSSDHIVEALGRAARSAAGDRRILLVSENEPQEVFQARPADNGGYGLDALWNDDFHHSARVALTGRREAYFHDHHGRAQEFVSAAKYGYLFQGQRYDWQNAQRGHPGFDMPANTFIHFIQNHDQIANTPGAQRICQTTAPANLRAMTALLLLGPQSPLLFQGQEFNAATPFHFFLDQHGELATMVEEGRKDFLGQFPSLDGDRAREAMPLPHDRSTFEASKLDWSEAERNVASIALYRDLLTLRRDTPVIAQAQFERRVDGAVLSESAFLLRYLGDEPETDRLLMINFGKDLPLQSVPDPLYAPPAQHAWSLAWSSEDIRYGGTGQREIDTINPFVLTAGTALFFKPKPAERRRPENKEALDSWQSALRST